MPHSPPARPSALPSLCPTFAVILAKGPSSRESQGALIALGYLVRQVGCQTGREPDLAP